MPWRAPRACPRPGCGNPQPCADHPPAAWRGGQRGRDMPPGWRASTVPRILARDPSCRLGYPGCLGRSTEVHHLVPCVDADWALAGVCRVCHMIETQRQAAAARGQTAR